MIPFYFIPRQQEKNISAFLGLALLIHLLFLLQIPTLYRFFPTYSRPMELPHEKTIHLNINATQTQQKVVKKQAPVVKEKALKKAVETKKETTTANRQANTATSKFSKPQAKTQIHATYPPLAEEMQIEGVVHMKFFVNALGKVLEVQITRSSGSKLLDRAAVKALKTASFSPATDDQGQAISSWGEYSLGFSLVEES